ncbi:MAG: SGNH/GDSL hydrolase family protein [Phycisphaera sp. RhM]|nr:SGNH/GDSL hydrolase family protein [Phycisphaera sp. RhM]
MKRRIFLSVAASAGTVACLNQPNLLAAEKPALSQDDVILFQGDSITDAGRNRKSPAANEGLGGGYPHFIAESLHQDYPDLNLQIHNRGISGNKVPDLDRRWQQDCLEIQPKILSILIGVNDIWHKLNGRYDGTSETYRDGFAALLERTRNALPTTTFVICEPFVLMSGTVKENRDKWFPEFAIRRKYANDVAKNAGAIWVPFQSMFDDAVAEGTEPKMLAGDGVHPTPLGHQLMAKTWRQVVGV